MAAIEHTSLLDIHAVAERLGVNVRWVRRKVATRAIPFIKLGHLVRFDLAEIEAWLEEARVPTAGQLVDDERCAWVEGHAGGRGVTGPPFRPVSSIRSTRASRQPSAGRDHDGLDPPSAS